MSDLLVITPSRDRPMRLAEMAVAVRDSTDGRALVLALVDDDDAGMASYARGAADQLYALAVGPRGSLSSLTNEAARTYAGDYPYLASLGDDHMPVTRGWDRLLIAQIESLDGPGWAYGDDGFQGGKLPTAWVQSSALVEALGWMMLPVCEHMFVDNAVLELGRDAGRLVYAPQVKIEHRHPFAGKADVDDSYRRSNAPAQFERDGQAFRDWLAGEAMARDVDLVRSLRH